MSVSVTMRIISTSQPSGGGSGGDAPQQQSLRGMHLPSSVANTSASGAINATAQAPAATSGVSPAAAATGAAANASNAQGAQ
ncbi:hypothetical protein [Burkholderia glumae]|uniref:hypothetical protein n=1 Tax=Burkholderia glumae TaxID=337 RepID=UPI003BF56673